MSPHPPSSTNRAPTDAIVVLGCRVRDGKPGAALERRLRAAAQAHERHPRLPIIMSGGRTWSGHQESEVMSAWWRKHHPESESVLREKVSMFTKENAELTAQLCRDLGYRHIILVTCDFHMARAERLFKKEALYVTSCEAVFSRSKFQNLRLQMREWGARLLELKGSRRR